MLRRICLPLTILAICGLPAVGHASPKRMSVTASIPESCILDAPAMTIDESGQSVSGMALEACNSARSYSISATTRVLENDEEVVLNYGSDDRLLEIDGSTKISNRSSPVFRNVPLSLRAGTINTPITVTLSMSPV